MKLNEALPDPDDQARIKLVIDKQLANKIYIIEGHNWMAQEQKFRKSKRRERWAGIRRKK